MRDMDTSSLFLPSVIILGLFALWLLLPWARNNRQRIVRSPATWAIVILLACFIGLHAVRAHYDRVLDHIRLEQHYVDFQTEQNNRIFLDHCDQSLKKAD